MTKNEWIKLINAIRLRKKEYSGQDGEITYRFTYRKASNSRYCLDGNTSFQLNYEECVLFLSYKNNSSFNFWLTCVYAHEAFFQDKPEKAFLEKIKKHHIGEAFIPHICTGFSTESSGSFGGHGSFPANAEEFIYHAGLYAAAFLYAFDVKDPYLQLVDDEWIVVDSKAGYFDFPTYFSHYQVIPIELPIPKFIDVRIQVIPKAVKPLLCKHLGEL